MKELLTYIAQSLVEHPESVSVTEHETATETVLEIGRASCRERV